MSNLPNNSQLLAVYCTCLTCKKPADTIPQDLPTRRKVIICYNCHANLVLRSRFLPIKPLGQGGFGRTFLALDLDYGSHPVRVIKQLSPKHYLNTLLTPEQLIYIETLFRREADILDQLKHQRIPRAIAHFSVEMPDQNNQTPQKLFYLVQEYVDGNDLSQEAKISEFKIIDLLYQILDILTHIHQQVIHRDIKPSNIIRDQKNQYWLIDFGAVKQVMQGIPTEQSVVVGTPDYAPPEQLAGQEVYPSSDLYSLAATCVVLLTGKSVKELRRGSTWQWQESVQISEKLANILNKMLSVRPEDRFQSAELVLQALKQQFPTNSEISFFEQNYPIANTLPQLPLLPTELPIAPEFSQTDKTYIDTFVNQETTKSRLPKRFFSKSLILKATQLFFALTLIVITIGLIKRVIHTENQLLLEPLSSEYFSRGRGDEPLIEDGSSSNNLICRQAFQEKKLGMKNFDAGIKNSDLGKIQEAREHFKKAYELFISTRKNLKSTGQNIYISERLPTDSCPHDVETLIYLNNTEAILVGNPFTIAVTVPYGNGELRRIATEILFGVAHVQSKVNGINIINDSIQIESGFRGIRNHKGQSHLLQVIIVNDKDDLEITMRGAQHLVNNQIPGDKEFTGNILAVIGSYSSDATVAGGKVYGNPQFKENRLVAISPTSTATRTKSFNPYIFRMPSTDLTAAQDLAEYIKNALKLKNILIVHNQDSSIYSRSLKDLFEIELKKRGISFSACNVDKKSADDCISKINNKFQPIDGVIFATSIKAFPIVEQIAYAIHNQVFIMGTDSVYANRLVQNINVFEGMILTVPWYYQLSKNYEFLRESVGFWGGDAVSWRVAASYDATLVLVEALKQISQQHSVTRMDLFNQLQTIDVEGVTGKIQFDNGERLPIKGLGVLVRLEKGGMTYIGDPQSSF